MMGSLAKVLSWHAPPPSTLGGAGLALVQLLVVYFVLRYLLNNIVSRIVVPLVAGEGGGRDKARSTRMRTLASVIRSTANYVLTFIIVLVALKKFGVDTTPVLASASVIGLAVGFGSQKLVRDVTTGFLLLAENQFGVGDYVTIGGITGTVEEIGMRATRLRDDAGKLYILSNGDISLVCNHSAGPMSSYLDIAIPASEDLARVRSAVEAVAAQIQEEFGEGLLEQPHVQGLVAVGAAQVTVRIRFRSVASAQEPVQMRMRELLRERFAQEGIALA